MIKDMKVCAHLFAVVILLMTITAAKATPVYGTFSGIVTYSSETSDGYYYYAYGTPVTGTYEYTPAFLTGGSTYYSDPTAYFQVDINGQELYSWFGNNLNLTVDANGVPVSGSGAGAWNLFLNSGGSVGMNATEYSILAHITYSTPSYANAAVPDIASTSCLAGIAMLSLAVFGRFTPRLRKTRTSAR